jgi:hypothetical protein
MLRTSERSTLKSCEWRWDLEFNQRIKPDYAMPALRFGTLWHKAMAAYYVPGIKRGENPVDAFTRFYEADLKAATKMGVRDEDGKWVEAGEMGVGMMQNYLDEYGKDERWKVLVTEQPFQVLVNRPESDPGYTGPDDPWFIYTGILDGVWLDRQAKKPERGLWIPDHKTTAGIGDSKLNYLVMDDQAGAYWSFGVRWLYAKGFLKEGQKLNGMLYSFARKALPDERQWKYVNGKRLYLNLDGSVSKKQPSPYFLRQPIFRDEYDRGQAEARAMNDYTRTELLRSGQLKISKNPGMFTCPGCWARDICELHETGNDYESMIKATTTGWDPYAEHEVYAGR